VTKAAVAFDETIPCIAPPARDERAARRQRHVVMQDVPRPRDIHPGDVVAGRYTVTRILSRERGVLLEASHTSFAQRVAIRVISPALASDPKAVERFHREARVLSQLESDHVARIIDVGTLDDGSLFLVRELLDGITLSQHAAQRLPLCEAVDLFLQVCEAVAEAHGHGVVIRDLQPSHVFLTKRRNGEPVAKLTDFGTCKVMCESTAGGELSCTKLFGLSPAASPELVRQDRELDERTDVWSLGCLLFELVSGAPAFVGEGPALMLAIAKDEPLPPSSLRRDIDVPLEIDRAVFRALAKSREHRFARVFDLALALRPFASTRGELLIAQIARLHGQPLPAPAVEEIADESMTMVRSMVPSDPALPSLRVPAALPVPARPSESRASLATMLPPASPLISTLPPPPRFQPWAESTPSRRRLPALLFGLPAAAAAALVALVSSIAPSDTASLAQAGLATAPIAIEAPAPTPANPVAMDLPKSVEDLREKPTKHDARPNEVGSGPKPTKEAESPKRPKQDPQFLASRDARVSSSPKGAKKPRDAKSASKPTTTAGPAAGTGTLVAMAIGASCAFAIDGATKGTRSSVRTEIAAGPHTVSCQPVDGSPRTRTVTVKPGEAAVAVFKF
jgi:eukaryotic-like serine/threonine-protein kinase